MGRAPCCTKVGLHRGPWTSREDALLTRYIQAHGEGQWRSLPKRAGLLRCGKSCRLRWMNYLRPDIKRGNISPEEDDLIIRMHSLLGNRWSLIAGRLPGRTDNEIKNYWNTHLSKKLMRKQGILDANTQKNPNSKKKKKKKIKKNIDKQKSRDNNNNGANGEAEKTMVYLPKPVRVKAVSCMIPTDNTFTLDSINSASTSHHDEERRPEAKDQANAIWGGFFGKDYDHNLVNGSDDLECHESDFPADIHGGTLEKLYEEYLQLLKAEDDQNKQELDSFAHSLLV